MEGLRRVITVFQAFAGRRIYASCFLMLPASLKHATARAIYLCATLFLCAACVSQSPGGTSEWGSVTMPGRASSVTETPPGQKAVTTGQEVSPSENRGSASGQAAADQPGSSTGWATAGQTRRSCAPPIPENEGLLHKIVRILSGPDWCGPDPDVDTNISAGGAAGG